jgi:hypothetical protein
MVHRGAVASERGAAVSRPASGRACAAGGVGHVPARRRPGVFPIIQEPPDAESF